MAAQPAPVLHTKRPRLVWWMTAASLAGVLLLCLWWVRHPSPEQTLAKQQNDAKPKAEYVHRVEAETRLADVKRLTKLTTVSRNKDNQLIINHRKRDVNASPTSANGWEPVETSQLTSTDNVPEYQPVETGYTKPTASGQLSAAAVSKPAVTTLKGRFQVVHENELKAEEEALYVQTRTKGGSDRFVRLGTGNQVSTEPVEQSPTILLPLNRKSTQ